MSLVSSGSTVQPLGSGATGSMGGSSGAAGGANGSAMEIRLVALEPTADNQAAVATVLVRLPGKFRTPLGLALGSTLVTMPRISGLGNNRILRRRRNSSHAVPYQHHGGGGGAGVVAQGHQVHPMQ